MDTGKQTYFLLLGASLLYPVLQSFEHRLRLWKRWPSVIPAIFITALPFLAWDVYFTKAGLWSFNPDYVAGISFLELPLEEWLFFLIIPYACHFVLAVLNHFFPVVRQRGYLKTIHWMLVVFFFVCLVMFHTRTYTVVTCSLAILVLAAIGLIRRSDAMLPRYYSAYLVCLVPFFIVNGILTALPVVSYSPGGIIGPRMFTIPPEDAVYLLSLLFLNFALEEYLSARWRKKNSA